MFWRQLDAVADLAVPDRLTADHFVLAAVQFVLSSVVLAVAVQFSLVALQIDPAAVDFAVAVQFALAAAQ
jgi:hypothetical protein